VLVPLALIAACGGGDDDDGSGEAGSGGGGAAGMTVAGGGASQAMSAGGSGASGASAGNAGASNAGSGGAGGTAVAGSAAAGSGSGMFSEVGVCGQRGEGMVDASTIMGFEEYYIIGEEGFGEDICVVRFDLERVGAAPEGCDDPAADVDCLWTHMVELSNPMVMTDVDGVCAESEAALTMAKIASLTGTRAAYGFVSEFAGHNSVLMKYDDEKKMWDAHGNATWDDESGAFTFDRRDGICNY
jgi:hypothetical protein